MQNQLTESWAEITGYEGIYEVSDQGRVRSLDRRVSLTRNGKTYARNYAGRVLKPTPAAQRGYPRVTLCRDGVETPAYVHTLVLEAFVSERPEGMQACHEDDEPTHNTPSNLRWDTRSGNMADAVRHGVRSGSRNHSAVLTGLDVESIRDLYANHGHTQTALASMFNVKQPTISKIVNHRIWLNAA